MDANPRPQEPAGREIAGPPYHEDVIEYADGEIGSVDDVLRNNMDGTWIVVDVRTQQDVHVTRRNGTALLQVVPSSQNHYP